MEKPFCQPLKGPYSAWNVCREKGLGLICVNGRSEESAEVDFRGKSFSSGVE
jgi:hypothetical protein